MAERNAFSIANRDEAIPTIRVTNHGDDRTPSPSRRERLRSRSQSRLEDMSSRVSEKLEKLGDKQKEKEGSSSVQDRLLNLLLSQVIPSDAGEDTPVDRRSRKYVDRPNFSVGAMSNNFRRFNARIGPVFVFQNRLIRLFTWRTPSHTLSFLAVYSFVCLDPYLLVVVPLALCLFFIMVPAFLTRHPPPPTPLPSELYPLGGPPLAPAPKIKPAPDLSKDFFRNMRDLQNSMDDFSKLHDTLLSTVLPPTNFSDEAFSSIIFTLMFFTCLLLFVAAHLIPWRMVFLLTGWTLLLSNHPKVLDMLEANNTSAKTPLDTLPVDTLPAQLHALAEADIILDPAPDKREVEIFELQHRNPYSSTSEWEPWVFTPHPYDPMSPFMIAGDRPKGTRYFEDVAPPNGYRWAEKKWTLDLLSREWVEERCITSVEVEVEGERWVSDLMYEFGDEEESEGAWDEESFVGTPSRKKGKEKEKEKGHRKKNSVITWEEGVGRHKLGEWRRRRWVRLVERMVEESGRYEGVVVSNE